MSRKLLSIFAGGALALAAAACGAVAAPVNLGGMTSSVKSRLEVPVRYAGAGVHSGPMGMHTGHMMGPHVAFDRRSHFDGRNFHHRHNRFFFVGYPYYYYDDGYYDDYDSGCWWSRSYHRWICGN